MRIDRLSPTQAPSCIEQFHSVTGWGLDAVELNCTLQAEGPLPPGCVAVVLILRANGSSLCGVKAEDGAVVVFPPGTTVAANVIPGFSCVGATVPASVWAAAQSIESGIVTERRPDHVSIRRLPAGCLAAIERQLDRTIVQLRAAEGDASAVMNEHVNLLARSFADGADAARSNRGAAKTHLRQARRARDWIHAHIDDAIRIADLCAALGTSRRQLEYAFRGTFDVSPREYIYALRLNQIRRALLRREKNEVSVTDIALLYGVTHLGRFAAGYRDLFGELPSQTRKSPRADMGLVSFSRSPRPQEN